VGTKTSSLFRSRAQLCQYRLSRRWHRTRRTFRPTKARITAVSTGGSSGLNNELSVDGADNSDDWIGGFLQNFSPDGIQNSPCAPRMKTPTPAGPPPDRSSSLPNTEPTTAWRPRFLRARCRPQCPLSHRESAEPAPTECACTIPSSPSRARTTLHHRRSIVKNKVWFFTSFEAVMKTPASATAVGHHTVQCPRPTRRQWPDLWCPSIAVPPNVPIPFRDYIGSVRFDWAQSRSRNVSAHFLRQLSHAQRAGGAGTLPSTGLTTHNNYWNTAISNATPSVQPGLAIW